MQPQACRSLFFPHVGLSLRLLQTAGPRDATLTRIAPGCGVSFHPEPVRSILSLPSMLSVRPYTNHCKLGTSMKTHLVIQEPVGIQMPG